MENSQMKPSVFIGSSSEEIDLALGIQSNLESVADPSVWTQGIFALSGTTMGSLLDALERTDFGVFVLGPTDVLKMRGQTFQAPRDNLVFELGLSIGRIGRDRTYFVVPNNHGDLHLPSDLLGVTAGTYDESRPDLLAALGPVCLKIRQQIKALGIRQVRLSQPTVELLHDATFLCAATEQYGTLGFDGDAGVLNSVFPGRVTVEHGITSERLEGLLMSQRPSVVHLVSFIDPKRGEIVFSEVSEGGRPKEPKALMPAEGFLKLVELSGVRLVVLASCDSLILAAKLARITNLIAATDQVKVQDIVRWERSFYDCLGHGQPLSTAYEIATSVSGAPMLLIMKKDFALGLGDFAGSSPAAP
jgi:hypothetical protein